MARGPIPHSWEEVCETMRNNRIMNKRLHVYGWDHEPKEERESAFASTGFAPSTLVTLAGYHPAMDPLRRQRRPARFGWARVLLFTVLLLAVGGWALYRFAPLLKAG